jgi:hypothetical protein
MLHQQRFPWSSGLTARKTKVAKLHQILSDHGWHSTNELSLRVGHTFAVAKFNIVRAGLAIEVERHPTKRHQFRYRLRPTSSD